MEFIESERDNQKLNIKLKKNCGGQLSCSQDGQLSGGLLSGRLLSCSQDLMLNYVLWRWPSWISDPHKK
jgi:hypothetical protein